MRITESRLRRIIKEELDDNNKKHLYDGLQNIEGVLVNIEVDKEDSDSEKLKRLTIAVTRLVQLLDRTIAR